MQRSHNIVVKGQAFSALSGEGLLDSALANGVSIPYNCRAGHCGTCKVRILEGSVKGGESGEDGIVHACQSKICGDVVVEPAEASTIKTTNGTVAFLRRPGSDVFEIGINTEQAIPYLPGQFILVQFAGFPARNFSLTMPLKGRVNGNMICLHVRRIPDGKVTPQLGRKILPGHKVTLTGPYGSAHFRPNLRNRLILVSSGTGFAPIWSITAAALCENVERQIMMVVGARSLESLYMRSVLGKLTQFPNVRILPVLSEAQNLPKAIKIGRPTDYMPRLHNSDIVYTCGAPPMVETVKKIAAAANAVCYADPFVPPPPEEPVETMLQRVMGWLPSGQPAREAPRLLPPPKRNGSGKRQMTRSRRQNMPMLPMRSDQSRSSMRS